MYVIKNLLLLLALLFSASNVFAQEKEAQTESNQNLFPPNIKILRTEYQLFAPRQKSYSARIPVSTAPQTSSNPNGLPTPSINNGSTTQGGISSKGNDSPNSDFLFVVAVELQNTGDKIIKAIKWDYVIKDKDSLKNIKSVSFHSKIHFAPNETIIIRERKSLFTAFKETEDYSKEVVIKEIEYFDGTKWKRPKEEKK